MQVHLFHITTHLGLVARDARPEEFPRSPPFESDPLSTLPHLTKRQLEVLRLLAEGRSTAEIASELGLRRTTVRNYIAKLLAALGVHTRLQAVIAARKAGLIEVLNARSASASRRALPTRLADAEYAPVTRSPSADTSGLLRAESCVAMSRAPRPIDLMTTLDRVKVPSAVVDRRGTVTWQNRATKETVGDLVGRPFVSIVAPEHKALAERQLERLLLGLPVADYDLELFTVDGRRRRAEISSVMIEGGEPYQAVFGIAVVGSPRSFDRRPSHETPERGPRAAGEGASTDQIAASLHLSKETVRNYIRQVLRALGAHSRLEAVALAHQHGLLGRED